MSELKIDQKKLELLKRSNELLEMTKKNYKKYEKERKIILELTTSNSVDYEQWENILMSIENLVNSTKDN